MKHFNNLKNHIRNEKSDLPVGFTWEEMQGDIYKKIQRDNLPSKFSWKPLLIPILTCIGLLFGILILFQNQDKEQSPTISLKQKIKNGAKYQTSKDADTHRLAFVPSNNISSHKGSTHFQKESFSNQSNNSVNTNQIEKAQLKSKNYSTPNTKESIELIDFSPSIYQKTMLLDQSTESVPLISSSEQNLFISNSLNRNSENEKIKVERNNLAETESDEILQPNYINKEPENKSTLKFSDVEFPEATLNPSETKEAVPYLTGGNPLHTVAPLPLLSYRLIRIQNNERTKISKYDFHFLEKVKYENRWSLELGGGWNTWDYTHKNNGQSKIMFSETEADYGFSFSLRLQRQLNEKLTFSTGIDFDLMYRKINVNKEFLKEREVKNALVSYRINHLTGIRHETYRDTILVDTTTHLGVIYHKYKVVSLPVMLNYKMLIGPEWSLDIGLGPSFSFISNYQGQYFDNNELLAFDTSSNLYSSSPKIALNANLYMRKRMMANYYFGFRIDYTNHLSNWLLDDTHSQKPKIIKGSIVIGKEF